MDLYKNAKIRVLDAWSTGCSTHLSNILDMRDYSGEDVTFVLTVPQTTSITSFGLLGSAATTVAGDFGQLAYNATNISISSTVTGGVQLIHVQKNTYRALRTVTNSTGITSQGLVMAIVSGVRSAPTTFASTEVLASFYCVSPTTT